jgi:hypothetical protein
MLRTSPGCQSESGLMAVVVGLLAVWILRPHHSSDAVCWDGVSQQGAVTTAASDGNERGRTARAVRIATQNRSIDNTDEALG